MIERLLNEDGSEFDPPKNPLWDKWERLYPPIPIPQYSQTCDGYSCMWCGRCPRGDNWKVPSEDVEIYNKYKKDYKDYIVKHNPSLDKYRRQ